MGTITSGPSPHERAERPGELLSAGIAQGIWTVDLELSSITFAVRHIWGLVKVRGRFTRFSGEAVVTAAGTITAQLSIDADSVDTRNSRRDTHLRSGDFFDAANHPAITFVTTGVTADASLHIVGDLSVAGNTRHVEFGALVLDADAQHATTAARVTIDHSDFGITWSPMGMARATADVALQLRWVKRPATAQ